MGAAQVGAAEERAEDLAGPLVEPHRVTFRVPDPERSLDGVRLYQEVHRPRNGPAFTFDEQRGAWMLGFDKPDADRIEYALILERHGNEVMTTDPHNPLTAPGAFGDKSVIEWPGYETPAWVTRAVDPGVTRELQIKSRTLRSSLETWLWAPAGTDPAEPLPLLVAHDGPEYARLSGLTRCLSAAIEDGRVPRMRAALVAPIDRDQIYSASAAYSRALAYEIVPQIDELAPVPLGRRARVGMGASLGGLAMLHLHRTSPASFGALFLQSGSFFRQRYDKQESGFPRFGRISRFMGTVLTATEWVHPVPVTLTCGIIEENLANNRATYAALVGQGYEARLVENRDGHNWVGWRDTFDPHLIDLLARAWS